MLRRYYLIQWVLFACCLLSHTAPIGAASAPSEQKPAAVIKDIPYPGAKKGERRRSLDLYLPADRGEKPPLLIFVHGGFWMLNDDQYKIGPAVAEALVREGVAVALLRYRLAPATSHPVQAEDVAAGVALLARDAKRYGARRFRAAAGILSSGGVEKFHFRSKQRRGKNRRLAQSSG
jgi:acetyl esterase/lipase